MQIEVTQNPNRYSYKDGVWKISAKAGLKPVEITEGSRNVELTPLLSVSGVIVHIKGTDYYLGSKELLQNLSDSFQTNPHFSYKEHSKVLGAKMGKTIPILEVKVDTLSDIIAKQKEKGKFAGVKEVKWATEDSNKGLIEQINWTLSPTSSKPKDKYIVYDLNLTGDYSVTSIPITPLDETKRIPEDVLANNLKVINDRIAELRGDFNIIKDIFYFGKSVPSSTTTFEILASAEGEEFEVQVITKESVVASKTATPAVQQAEEQKKAVEAVKAELEALKNEAAALNGESASTNKPNIEKWKVKAVGIRTLFAVGGINIYPPKPDFPLNPNGTPKENSIGKIKLNGTFSGYLFKTLPNGNTLWAIQDSPNGSPSGYVYQAPKVHKIIKA